MQQYKYRLAVASHGGERLRRIVILAAGVLALSTVAVLAVFGVVTEGGHAWHSIQVAMNAAAGKVALYGGYAWH